MAIATVFTRGYGNGTFNGTIPLVLRRGYLVGDVVAAAPTVSMAPIARTESIAASVARGVKSTESISKAEKTTEGFSRP